MEQNLIISRISYLSGGQPVEVGAAVVVAKLDILGQQLLVVER
jgi:hypothetical protein